MSAATFDLVVVGGGPGGATLATLVAAAGNRVLLLEREHFPRHQIGESLLPATVHGICPLLGVKDEIEGAGFPRKRGGTFRWGKNPAPWTFTFSKTEKSPIGYAYQVERSRFDKILLDNARRRGVDVREGHTVQGPITGDQRVEGVRYVDPEGKTQEVRARFVADAGGNRSGMYKTVGDRVFSRFFQNVALYAYFENGKRLPPPNGGNILCAAFAEGWFWYIPLSDTLTSVGAVVAKEHAERALKSGEESAFREFVAACPMIGEYLAPAKRIETGMYGEYRVRKDYSYCNTRFWRPGLALIGDAACFIDPVFSSGVHLATYSAVLAARSMNTLLKGQLEEHAVFDEFERRYRREFGNFYQYLVAFYDMHRDETSYFWAARKILNSKERDNEAFVRLVAGLSQDDEPLFSGQSFLDAREGLGDWFYGVAARQSEGLDVTGTPSTFDKSRFDPDKFMEGFNAEIMQLQMQAQLGARRPKESPLVAGGLVPTEDGLHWRQPPTGGRA
jgi:halogenation protein CepH